VFVPDRQWCPESEGRRGESKADRVTTVVEVCGWGEAAMGAHRHRAGRWISAGRQRRCSLSRLGFETLEGFIADGL
jgi:hypothetical protein